MKKTMPNRMSVSMIVIAIILINTTATSFALNKDNQNNNINVSKTTYIEQLPIGQYIEGNLKISENTVVPFEQGSYWRNGGTIVYSKLFIEITQSIIESFLIGCISHQYSGIKVAANIIWDAIKNKNNARIMVKESCMYRMVTDIHIEHNHIIEYYYDDTFLYSDSFSYYGNDLHNWPKQ